ncbi:hypothetical protein ES705_50548 [subsurface metagenome]
MLHYEVDDVLQTSKVCLWDSFSEIWYYELPNVYSYGNRIDYWFSADDSCANHGESSIRTFTVSEHSTPTVMITRDSEYIYTIDDYLTITVVANDESSGSGIRSLSIYWYTSGEEANCWTNEYDEYTFEIDYSTPEDLIGDFERVGYLHYYIRIIDYAGNCLTTEEESIEIRDNQDPQIIVQENDNLYLVENSDNIICYSEDASIIVEIKEASNIAFIQLYGKIDQSPAEPITSWGEISWDEYYHDYSLLHYKFILPDVWDVIQTVIIL